MVAKNGSEPILAPSADGGIMELSLMLPRRQFEALLCRARQEGMSVAQFLRRLVHDAVIDQTPVS